MLSTKTNVTALQFEPEFMAVLQHLTEEFVSFNKVLGLKLESANATTVVARMEMQPHLVGHATYNRIHGGAISAALDAMAGVAVMAAIGAKHMDEPVMQRAERFARLGHHRFARGLYAPRHWRALYRPSRGAAAGFTRSDHAHGVFERARRNAGRGHGGLHHLLKADLRRH